MQVRRGQAFLQDFEDQYRWYLSKAGEKVAEHYFKALEISIEKIEMYPHRGRLRNFSHPSLLGIRSYAVESPFARHIVFYRFEKETLFLERVLHGARDLRRRLQEPPRTP